MKRNIFFPLALICISVLLTGCFAHSWHAPEGPDTFFLVSNQLDEECTVYLHLQEKTKWKLLDWEEKCPANSTTRLLDGIAIGNYTPAKFFNSVVVVLTSTGDTLYHFSPVIDKDWKLNSDTTHYHDGCISRDNNYTLEVK